MTRFDAEGEMAIQNQINGERANERLANNLKRIDRLTRLGLLQFLDMQYRPLGDKKSSTARLRSKARLIAIAQSNTFVDMDLARVEQSND